MKRLLSLIFALAFAAVPARAERAVTVFAAASLGGVLEEIASSYDGEVVFSYAGSGSIARQIAAGAPADLVLLASPVWMRWLADNGIAPARAPVIVARGTLVVIAPKDTAKGLGIAEIPQYLGANRLAMGHRSAVPAGVYARQWLGHAGLWPQLAQQVAETDNVRAALALVARGETPLGIVYASDAAAEPAVQIVLRIPATAHDEIVYPAAALTPQGGAFLDHLVTPQAQGTFAAHAFSKSPPS